MSNKTFKEKWLNTVDNKNSVLCAGIDPAIFEMGREKKGLSEGVNKKEWTLKYIEAVAPFVAAIKPNTQYWKDSLDMGFLKDISELAHSKGLVVIEDAKLADIGSTNDAGFFYTFKHQMDAVTFSPFAGNMEEATKQAHNYGLGLISMVLMSNPEFKREKNNLVYLDTNEISDYSREDFIHGRYVKKFIQLAHDAKKFGIEGIVIGAPSEKNHISGKEISKVRKYVGKETIVLMPGVGAQGGEAESIWKYFDTNMAIVNVGRGLMFIDGPDSTPEQHREGAKYYQEMLNKLRTKN